MQKERVEADIRNLCRYLLFMTSQLIWTQNIWRLDFVKMWNIHQAFCMDNQKEKCYNNSKKN